MYETTPMLKANECVLTFVATACAKYGWNKVWRSGAYDGWPIF